MSPTAYTLTIANQAVARGLPPARQVPMQVLQQYLAAKLLDTTPPTNLREGTPVEVLWCKASTPTQPAEPVWCPGTYVQAVGIGANTRHVVRCATPRTATPNLHHVARESLRLAQQVAP